MNQEQRRRVCARSSTATAATCHYMLPPHNPADLGRLPTMLYACVSGALGVVVSLPREQYLLLERLQVWAWGRTLVRFVVCTLQGAE